MKPAALGQALSAYATAAARLAEPRKPDTDGTAEAGFGAVLRAELARDVATLKTSEATAVAGVAGKADLQSVVEAVTNAELTLSKVTAVRDRVIAAYQEILRMPI